MFVPSRQLTVKEYNEFNAVFDIAKAGTPDMVLVEEILGEQLMDEWNLEKSESKEIQSEELRPFTQTHILISFPPEKMIDVQEYLQKITDMPFVQYEQSSN